MNQIIHNLGLVALCSLIAAAVLVAELAVAARINKIHVRRELTRQINI